MKTGVATLLLLVSSALSAQVNTFKRTYGGTGEELPAVMLRAADGNLYLTGSSGTNGSGQSDAYVIKTDTNGNVIWSKFYGTNAIELITGGVVEPGGNLVLCGYTNRTGEYDAMLIKIDTLGNEIWTRTYGGKNWEFGRSVLYHPTGDYFLTGETYSFGSGSSDIFLVRTDSAGTQKWLKTYGGSDAETAASLTRLTGNKLGIAGTTASHGKGKDDIYLLYLKPNGDTLWTRTYGDTLMDKAYQVTEGIDGEIVLVGSSQSISDFKQKSVIYKVKSDGTDAWNITFFWVGGNNEFAAIDEYNNGSYALAGSTDAFGVGGKDYKLEVTGPNSGWALPGMGPTYGSDKDDVVRSVLVTNGSSAVYLFGSTAGLGAGNTDMLLIKCDTTNFQDTSGYYVGHNEPVGMGESFGSPMISSCPNPTTGNFSIAGLSQHLLPAKMHVCDYSGRIIKEFELGDLEHTINLESLTNGVYHYRIICRNGNLLNGKVILTK